MLFRRGRLAEPDAQREQRLRHRRELLAQRVEPRLVARALRGFVLEQRLDGALRADGAAGEEPGFETAVGFANQLADGGRCAIVDVHEDGGWSVVMQRVSHTIVKSLWGQLRCHTENRKRMCEKPASGPARPTNSASVTTIVIGATRREE